MVFPTEMISLFGGMASGFLFRLIAVSMENKQKMNEMLINRIKAFDDSSNQASKRDNSKAGQITRRLIVVSVILSVLMFPFILALMDKPVAVEVHTPIRDWFWGVFQTGGKSIFYQIDSFLLIPEIRQSLLILIGYYFGNSSLAKR